MVGFQPQQVGLSWLQEGQGLLRTFQLQVGDIGSHQQYVPNGLLVVPMEHMLLIALSLVSFPSIEIDARTFLPIEKSRPRVGICGRG